MNEDLKEYYRAILGNRSFQKTYALNELSITCTTLTYRDSLTLTEQEALLCNRKELISILRLIYHVTCDAILQKDLIYSVKDGELLIAKLEQLVDRLSLERMEHIKFTVGEFVKLVDTLREELRSINFPKGNGQS